MVLLALMGIGLLGPPSATPRSKPEAVTLTGNVVELAEALKPLGLAVDAEPAARQVVVQGEGGEVVPLLPDEGSRALSLDERLRRRPVEIQGRKFPGLPYVQVVSLRVKEDGRWRTPEYYCDVCTIHVRFPQPCPCCQGPMELRLKPEAP